MNIIVLGGGLIGSPLALDISKDADIQVTVADINEEILTKLKKIKEIETVRQDLSDTERLKSLISDFDMVVSSVPGFMGYKILKTIIETGKNVVDIAFFPEDALELDSLAKQHSVTAVVDCGVAPGMSNMLTGYADHMLDETESALIYVGGLPEIRQWPYEYKAVFSPADVIQEYIRPAFYVENRKIIKMPALSDPEYIYFPGLGTLEAFNTDGLRSLIKTMDIPNMKEKTMRYPGHIDKIILLRESGFFSEEAVEVNGKKIKPLDITSQLLFSKWKLEEGEVDITVMKIIVKGKKGGKAVSYTYDLLDKYDPVSKVHSMARATGYTAAMVLRLLKTGMFKTKGIIPPELIGRHPECVAFVLKGLRERGLNYVETVST